MNIPAEVYFERVQSCWHEAEAVTGSIKPCYRIAGRTVQIALAGRSLHPLMMRPFAHLRLTDCSDQPDLIISVWDVAESGVAMPPPPCSVEGFTARGEFKNFGDRRYCASFQPFGQILNVLDRDQRRAFAGVADATHVYSYERAIPLRAIFGWFMPLYGRQLVHAASVGTQHGGVLIVGAGGVGKSNTALGSLAAGLDFVSDDFCVVSADPAPAVHSLYCTSRVRSWDWAALSFPRSNANEPETEKSLHFLVDHFPGRVSAGFPLCAMLLPSRSGSGPPKLRAASAIAAVAQMASQSTAMLPNAGSEVLSRLMQLARRVPAFHLDLGTEPHRVPAIIREVIDGVRAAH